MQPVAFTPTRKAALGRLDPPRMALCGPRVATQVHQPSPLAGGARGVARPKPGPGRGEGPARGDVTLGRWQPGSSSPIKPVSRDATSSLHAHSENCSGAAVPPTHGPLRASRGNSGTPTQPLAGGARGVARPKPGPGRGAGLAQWDVTPGRSRLGSSCPIKPFSRNAPSSLHAHSEGCFGEAGPPTCGPFQA